MGTQGQGWGPVYGGVPALWQPYGSYSGYTAGPSRASIGVRRGADRRRAAQSLFRTAARLAHVDHAGLCTDDRPMRVNLNQRCPDGYLPYRRRSAAVSCRTAPS